MMRIGIYGGTFAPIHNGHVGAALEFKKKCALDRLLIIPAAIPPHKQIDFADDPKARLEMCRLAFEDAGDGIEISDIEICRGGKSYTVETLRALSGDDRELWMLCGTDMILTLDEWFCFEEIFRLCHIVGVRRENERENTENIERKISLYRREYGADIEMIDVDVNEISSTGIRRMISAGEDVSGLIPPKVAGYVKEKRLYID